MKLIKRMVNLKSNHPQRCNLLSSIVGSTILTTTMALFLLYNQPIDNDPLYPAKQFLRVTLWLVLIPSVVFMLHEYWRLLTNFIKPQKK